MEEKRPYVDLTLRTALMRVMHERRGRSVLRGSRRFDLFAGGPIGPLKLDHRKPVNSSDSLGPATFYDP